MTTRHEGSTHSTDVGQRCIQHLETAIATEVQGTNRAGQGTSVTSLAEAAGSIASFSTAPVPASSQAPTHCDRSRQCAKLHNPFELTYISSQSWGNHPMIDQGCHTTDPTAPLRPVLRLGSRSRVVAREREDCFAKSQSAQRIFLCPAVVRHTPLYRTFCYHTPRYHTSLVESLPAVPPLYIMWDICA